MAEVKKALSTIPAGLRKPLLKEYNNIVQNYMERRWSPSELSGGHFSEVVYTIIEGMGSTNYASRPSKPRNFVDACKKLENYSNLPRSLRILIPRFLPPLYEIRNNRGVGHVGGDVDPNHMDSNAVLAISNWIMAELVRVLHSLSIEEAQKIVDALSERRIPLIWESSGIKRVLNPKMALKDQILVLIASCPNEVTIDEIINWTDTKNKTYFVKIVKQLHKSRLVEFDQEKKTVLILPPGSKTVFKLLTND
ncbi:MAG: hypothetical protein ACYSTS_17770 [Planctomycetota bacterium]|jgi:hypothetical protein